MVWVLENRRQRSEALRQELAEPLGNHQRSDGRKTRWSKDLMHPCDLYRWHSDAYHTHYKETMEIGCRSTYHSAARIPYWAMVKPFQHDNHQMFGLYRYGDDWSVNFNDGILESLSVHINFSWDALSRMTAVVKEVREQSDRDRLDLNAEVATRQRGRRPSRSSAANFGSCASGTMPRWRD